MGKPVPVEGEWISVEIIDAAVEKRERPVVALTAEGEECVDMRDVDFFVLKLRQSGDKYAHRKYPYQLSVPCHDVQMPFKRPKAGKLGFWSTGGSELLQATELDSLSASGAPLPELAKAMIGKIVLAQVYYRRKKYPDADGPRFVDFDLLRDAIRSASWTGSRIGSSK